MLSCRYGCRQRYQRTSPLRKRESELARSLALRVSHASGNRHRTGRDRGPACHRRVHTHGASVRYGDCCRYLGCEEHGRGSSSRPNLEANRQLCRLPGRGGRPDHGDVRSQRNQSRFVGTGYADTDLREWYEKYNEHIMDDRSGRHPAPSDSKDFPILSFALIISATDLGLSSSVSNALQRSCSVSRERGFFTRRALLESRRKRCPHPGSTAQVLFHRSAPGFRPKCPVVILKVNGNHPRDFSVRVRVWVPTS